MIVVSACLLGENVTYRGDSNKNEELIQLLKHYDIIKVCPEVMGGLSIPRNPSEIKSFNPLMVVSHQSVDVTEQFLKGSIQALEKIKNHNVKIAILKANSPSCGNEYVYDGTFSSSLVEGSGVFASMLKGMGMKVFNEKQIEEIKEYLREEDSNGTCFKD